MKTTRARPRTFKIWLGSDDCERLYQVAHRRGVLPEQLMQALIRIVLRESLTDAVIDDEPVVGGSPVARQ